MFLSSRHHGFLSQAVEGQGYVADHPPPSSTEVINTWIYTSASPHTRVAWCLIRHRSIVPLTCFMFRTDPVIYHIYYIPGFFVSVFGFPAALLMIQEELQEQPAAKRGCKNTTEYD
jgi:hypothetical protein